MKIELTDEARHHVSQIDAWWRENRPAAPDLFLNELERVLSLLSSMPSLGTAYDAAGIPTRRLLLPRTHYHVYFTDSEDALVVLAVWSAFRGRGPALGSRT